MNQKQHTKPISKSFHPNSAHNNGYNFAALIAAYPPLRAFVKENKFGDASIAFANPEAVKALNTALLAFHYGIEQWSIPNGYLCPPIPGRVDYIHYIADLLEAHDKHHIKLLDIGTGANGIYALLASQVYGWQCTATDIDTRALDNLQQIINQNTPLNTRIALRQQKDKSHIFKDIIQSGEQFDVSVCNPPFHASLVEAQNSNRQKVNNLAMHSNIKRNKRNTGFNFGGKGTELWCEGGERQFLRTMMNESKLFATQCQWFTTLVSKSEYLAYAKKHLKSLEAKRIKVIDMHQGNKITRILAWTF